MSGRQYVSCMFVGACVRGSVRCGSVALVVCKIGSISCFNFGNCWFNFVIATSTN